MVLDNDDNDPFVDIKITVEMATIDPIIQYFLVPDDDWSTTVDSVDYCSLSSGIVASSTFSGTDATSDP